jgi:hypothetical protein
MKALFKQPGVAAMAIPDEDNKPPARLSSVIKTSARNASLLFVIWTIIVLGKSFVDGKKPSKVIFKATRIASFLIVFMAVDIVVLLYWPKMSQNFVQAGLYYIATLLFSCLKP